MGLLMRPLAQLQFSHRPVLYVIATMLHSVHDTNPARLNAAMPTLQRMEHDSSLFEYRERRVYTANVQSACG